MWLPALSPATSVMYWSSGSRYTITLGLGPRGPHEMLNRFNPLPKAPENALRLLLQGRTADHKHLDVAGRQRNEV